MNFWKAIIVVSCLLSGTTAFAQQDELLPPEQAFNLHGQVKGDTVIAEFNIAPGYYMYHKSFKFNSETPDAVLGKAFIPAGHIKQDEFFGKVEIYRGRVPIKIPVHFNNGQQPQTINIKAVGQGCADRGVCYPPLTQTLLLPLAGSEPVAAIPYQAHLAQSTASATTQPLQQAANSTQKGVAELQNLLGKATKKIAQNSASKPARSADNPLTALQALGSDIGLANDEDIPDPDKAFLLSTRIDDNNVIHADIKIYPNTYLYRNKIKTDLLDGKGHRLGAILLPDGDIKNDEFFGKMEVYHHRLNAAIPVLSDAHASDQLTLAYGYQGCVQDKICYPPITKYFKVDLARHTVEVSDQRPALSSATQTSPAAAPQGSPTTTGKASAANSNAGQSEQDRFTGIIAHESLLIIIGSFFLAGVLLTFTPCVFPMIPILSGIIAGQGENITTRKAFSLSLVYVVAMATTYAVVGAIVGLFGAKFNIQIWFQDPVILSIFAALFVLLALSMFGFYELQMPSFIQSRITEISNRQKGGEMVGVGIMGLLSALIVGPCITAPLVGALAFIGQTQDWKLGGLALFALGIGMGTPLLLIGTTAGKYLPRAGTWMDAVKAVFGVAMLAVAVWLLERILPTSITMLLMAALIIVSAVYMGALQSLPQGASGWHKLWKGLGLVLFTYGLFYLYGVAAGSKDLIQPLKGLGGTVVTVGANASGRPAKTHVVFQRIKGQQGLKQALAAAKGKPVMLDFYADWCVSCKEMEKYAFKHPAVLKALEGFVTLQSDVTKNDEIDKQFMSSLGIFGPPAILFFDKNGQEIKGSRVVGEMSGKDFANHIINFARKASNP